MTRWCSVGTWRITSIIYIPRVAKFPAITDFRRFFCFFLLTWKMRRADATDLGPTTETYSRSSRVNLPDLTTTVPGTLRAVYIPIKWQAGPQRHVKPVDGVWSRFSFLHAAEEELVLASPPTRELCARVWSKTDQVQKRCWGECGAAWSAPCALPFPSLPVFAAAAKGASRPSIKCQADHIDAPPSPQQSLIREQTPTLQRTANSVREAGEALAASPLWLDERRRQSYPRSLFSSRSFSAVEARCKKHPPDQKYQYFNSIVGVIKIKYYRR